MCSVLQTVVNPLVSAGPKLRLLALLQNTISAQETWTPDAKGLMNLGVSCDAMQPLYLS